MERRVTDAMLAGNAMTSSVSLQYLQTIGKTVLSMVGKGGRKIPLPPPGASEVSYTTSKIKLWPPKHHP